MIILPVMFGLGLFSVTVQVLFMREMLVSFFGNELSIGAILGSWLLGISAGAFSARRIVERVRSERFLRNGLAVLLCLLASALPVQIYLVRTVRAWLDVPVGEYAPLGTILFSAFAIFLPTCWGIGFFFPAACRILSRARSNKRNGKDVGGGASALVYAVEALGSMVGGVLLTFALLPLFGSVRLIFLASGGLLANAAVLAWRCPAEAGWWGWWGTGKGSDPAEAGSRGVRHCHAPGRWGRVPALAAVVLLVLALCPRCLRTVERGIEESRWRAFGALPSGGASDVVRLVDWRDSVYQNLAVTESYGQFVLYGNGQVMFAFPAPSEYEHAVHFVMAQRPAARRILMIGGNPVGELPELLKYPLARLVYVELDPAVGRLVSAVVPASVEAVLGDPRVEWVAQDAVRYVRRCRERFDVVLVNAPNPASVSLNRTYTQEFYRHVRRILAPDGFMHTTVHSAERLESEATDLGASVYRTLKTVFPVVLVTAEAENQFFAGSTDAGLTFDRDVLYAQSAEVGLSNAFFRPRYFHGIDMIEPAKTAFVEDRFERADVPVNTGLRPTAFFYNLILWSRFSGSGMESVLHALQRVRTGRVVMFLCGGGFLMLLVGAGLRAAGARAHTVRGHWSRLMTGLVIGTTGFSAMALELVLVFAFQNLYGTIYTRMGLIVAAFMLGLVAGAGSGRAMLRRANAAWWRMAGLEAALLVFALLAPSFVRIAAGDLQSPILLGIVEAGFYLAVAVLGGLTGAQFPLGNHLFCRAGGSVGAAAAITDAGDHLGAALGCFVVGVALVPVLGVGAACGVIAALKGAGLLCLGSGALALGSGE